MSADGSERPKDPDPLQFDVAEHASPQSGGSAGAQSCTQCAASIASSYYEVNGLIICPRCRGTLASLSEGSRGRRVLTAAGLGLLAAIGGSLVYYAIAALTGYEFGLVAIAVGVVVGKAVNKGSRGRGGWAYQTLAILLTYFAIVSTYIPLAVREFRANPAQADSLRTAIGVSAPDSLDADDHDEDSTHVAAADARHDSTLPVTQAGKPSGKGPKAVKIGAGTIVLGMLALLAFAAIIPILAGFSNIIGLVIIFFAVFQAWQLNKRVPLEITGPYRVGGGERPATSG